MEREERERRETSKRTEDEIQLRDESRQKRKERMRQ
jgi:hypothetical protein